MISRNALPFVAIAGAALVAIGAVLFLFSDFATGTTVAVIGAILELVGVIA